MNRHRIITISFFIVLLLVWELISRLEIQSSVLFPAPSQVFMYLWDATTDGSLLSAIWITCKRLLIGYFIGILMGVPMGMLAARFRVVNDTLGVIALGLQALPSVCWVPLAVLWFGPTEGAMLFVVIMGSLWSVILSTENGMRNVPPIYSRAARTMGAGPLYTLVKVTLPAAAPFVVSGMKQGWAFAWRSLMAAEIYVSILSGFGLGQLLHYGRELMSMDQVLAIMLTIVLIGLLADKIIFSPVERMLHRRWGTNRN